MLSGRHRRPAANNAKAFHRGGRALKGMTKSIGILILLLALTLGVAAAPEAVVPGGDVIGLELWSEGVCVVEFSAKAPEKAGLRTGDLICAVDGVPIATAAELTRAVEASAGAVLCLTVSRDGAEKTVRLAPTQTAEGWRLGVYVRDRITGVGTVTYYDPSDNSYGALGHGVNQGKTLLPLRSGTVASAAVTRVQRGRSGAAGTLQGAAVAGGASGSITRNTARGIFGTMDRTAGGALMDVADAAEVRTGPATIRSTVAGAQVREYAVEITALHPDDPDGRNMSIQVTDPALLTATGGIVQGMSGSPIIQDGKLVGAVTHVLIDDPAAGYGIFIENMLEAAGAAGAA